MGTMIEWLIFYIFGSLAVVISTNFSFPADNPTAVFLATLQHFLSKVTSLGPSFQGLSI
jgi:hypothetical protein